MNITVDIIPHEKERYETCADWIFDDFGDLRIKVSDTGDEYMNSLIALHEQIEAILCKRRGITERSVLDFDMYFEANREAGNVEEPGDSELAPYHKEHVLATKIEKVIAKELGINWKGYSKIVDSL